MHYNPSTDILYVEYPDLGSLQLPVIKHSLAVLVENIRNYDVRKLLLDSSDSEVWVSEKEGRAVALQLTSDLMKTRLLKVAHVLPLDPDREKRVQANINQVPRGTRPYQLQTFDTKEDAMAWLGARD
ncbi:hypothetical protein [Pontibacter chitinilyticus]|uniref:hypothetical protein n=1 Tax=Pontibacter chitinilyticus TaxID=2674989 RepID=UPI00321A967F